MADEWFDILLPLVSVSGMVEDAVVNVVEDAMAQACASFQPRRQAHATDDESEAPAQRNARRMRGPGRLCTAVSAMARKCWLHSQYRCCT